MIFQIWEITDHVSRCIAYRTREDIKAEFYDMEIGEQRPLGNDLFIMRAS